MRVCPQADFVSSRQSRDETGFCYGALRYPESQNNNKLCQAAWGQHSTQFCKMIFAAGGRARPHSPPQPHWSRCPPPPAPTLVIALRSPVPVAVRARGGV